MKVMDVSVDEKECSGIEMVTPPRKKMKQAQLPFQMISPSKTPETAGNKKRKFESPSPVDKNAIKNKKSANKSNSAKRAKASDIEVISIDLESCNENMPDEQSYKSKTTEKQKSDIDRDRKASEEDAKENLQFEATNREKRKECRPLNELSKESRSTDANDDTQLLTEKNPESDKSKDSDVTLKPRAESPGSKEKSDQSLEESNKENMETVTPGSVVARQDVQTQNDTTQSTNEKASLSVSVETKDDQVENDCVEQQTKILSSDGCQNLDSDSDAAVSSSDDDPDDEPEKSSNETGDKDKSQNENVGSKTPKSVKSHSSTISKKKLTPKQIERRLEITKKREIKQQLKMEKQKQREEKQKEKEMREMKKQNEIKQKQKEKEAKEEERRKKEEERRKKEEEKLEMERKKQKAAFNFANFFVAKKQDTRVSEEENLVKIQNFMPFEVKMDMRVAPITRRNFEQDEKSALDNFVAGEIKSNGLYLDLLKENSSVIRKSGKTWPNEAKDDVVIIDEAGDTGDMVEQCPSTVEKHRPKFFMFTENRRPPFWGTWRKRSNRISARCPFVKDPKWFDYEVDSDDEWEEEEPGESIRGSDDEREDDGADDNEYDVDNDFMVPHGYLSDEEAKADEEDSDATSPETQKMKLKLLGEQFEAERKTQTSRIQPRVMGCIWQGSSNDYPENTPQRLARILTERQAWVREIPISLPTTATTETISSVEGSSRKKAFPEDAIPNLIRLVHGNNHSRIFLTNEFMVFWMKNKTDDREISKVSVSQKIREIANWIACPEEGPMHMKSCWYVRQEIRNEYNCTDVTVPNRWTYTLPPTRRSDIGSSDIEKPEKQEKKRVPLITQFTKKITQEEKQKQLASKPGPVQSKPPKRVALISVPRGEQFDKPIESRYFSKITANPSIDKTGVVEEPKAADGEKQLSISKRLAGVDRIDKVETTAEDTNSRERTIIDLSSDNEDAKMNETEENLVGSVCSNETAKLIEAKSSKATDIKSQTRQKFEPEQADSSEDCIVLD